MKVFMNEDTLLSLENIRKIDFHKSSNQYDHASLYVTYLDGAVEELWFETKTKGGNEQAAKALKEIYEIMREDPERA